MSSIAIVVRYKSIIYTDDQVRPMGEKGAAKMTTVSECAEGHYEVQKMSHGEAYVWCPECVVVECDCGARLVLTASEAVCKCGAVHASLVRQQLASQRRSYGAPHPWEVEYQEWRKKQDEYLLSEEIYRLELSDLD